MTVANVWDVFFRTRCINNLCIWQYVLNRKTTAWFFWVFVVDSVEISLYVPWRRTSFARGYKNCYSPKPTEHWGKTVFYSHLSHTGSLCKSSWTVSSKRRIACHRRVCWWAWSPIMELQMCEKLSHGQLLRLLRGCPLLKRSPGLQGFDPRVPEPADRFMAQSPPGWAILRVTAQLTGPSCAASCWPSECLCTVRLANIADLPTASCPWNTCLWMQLSGMWIMWPTRRSRALNRKASMPVIPQMFRTSVLGILFCHLTRAILRRQRRWNCMVQSADWSLVDSGGFRPGPPVLLQLPPPVSWPPIIVCKDSTNIWFICVSEF